MKKGIFNNLLVRGTAKVCTLKVRKLQVNLQEIFNNLEIFGDLIVHGSVIQTHEMYVEKR
jgi:hypothetical protein